MSCKQPATHVKPELWVHRDGKASCPHCGKYLGRVDTRERKK